jgi:hypothetical protein
MISGIVKPLSDISTSSKKSHMLGCSEEQVCGPTLMKGLTTACRTIKPLDGLTTSV